MEAGEALAVMVAVFTVTVTVEVAVQPDVVPVTVYVVVAVGETDTEAPDKLPGFHEYVVAPDAVSVELDPLQIVTGDAEDVTVGTEFTVIVPFAVLLHPPPDKVTVEL